MTRLSRDAYGLKLAEAAALRADCTRRQVGAVVIAPDGSVVSTGYNGLAAGLPGCASEGTCPRGRMAYPMEAPCKVGDPDTTSVEDAMCYEADPDGWVCTMQAGHDGQWHIAGGVEVYAIWPVEGAAQPADTGYEATGCRAVHAEVNAILRGRGREGCVGATIYVTDEPCFHCSVVIEGAGIVRVVTPTVETTWSVTDIGPVRDAIDDLSHKLAMASTAYSPGPVGARSWVDVKAIRAERDAVAEEPSWGATSADWDRVEAEAPELLYGATAPSPSDAARATAPEPLADAAREASNVAPTGRPWPEVKAERAARDAEEPEWLATIRHAEARRAELAAENPAGWAP